MDLHHGGMLPRSVSDRVDNWVDAGSGQMNLKKNYYLERNLDRLLGVAERRVEALRIIRELQVIEHRLKILNRLGTVPKEPESPPEVNT